MLAKKIFWFEDIPPNLHEKIWHGVAGKYSKFPAVINRLDKLMNIKIGKNPESF